MRSIYTQEVDIIEKSRLNKLLIITSITAIAIILVLSTYEFYHYMSNRNEDEDNLSDDISYDVPDIDDIKIKTGRYYHNGDTNSYYFEITDGNHIQLHCDDMHALFETWNPGDEEAINEDVAFWTGEKEFKIVVTEIGTVILAVKWEYDDSSNLKGVFTGPCWLDENTLNRWGFDGDFKYVETSETSLSSE